MNGRRPLHPHLDSAQNSMQHGLGELAEYFGFNHTLGQIYGALLLHDRPLSLDDLAQQVCRSKACVSQYTRTMEHLGMIRCVRRVDPELGNRQKYYEAETDFQMIAGDLIAHKASELERIQGIIGENIALLHLSREGDVSGQEIDLLIKRISPLFELMGMMKAYLDGSIDVLRENHDVTAPGP